MKEQFDIVFPEEVTVFQLIVASKENFFKQSNISEFLKVDVVTNDPVKIETEQKSNLLLCLDKTVEQKIEE